MGAGADIFGCPSAVRRAFRAEKRPVALAHVLALAEAAPDVWKPDAPAWQVLAAETVLSLPPEKALAFRRPRWRPEKLPEGWLRKRRERVAEALAGAFAAALPVAREEEGGGESVLGWWAELLHFAVASCGMGLEEALAAPVARLFVLAAAAAAASGAKFAAPGYAEEDALALLGEPPDVCQPLAKTPEICKTPANGARSEPDPPARNRDVPRNAGTGDGAPPGRDPTAQRSNGQTAQRSEPAGVPEEDDGADARKNDADDVVGNGSIDGGDREHGGNQTGRGAGKGQGVK
jgi:hypothetical protein